jgi:hypothetical protein
MLLVPGTGTLKSVTYEVALIEAAQLLELAEESSPFPGNVDFTDVTHNNAAKTTTVTCSLPIAVTMAAGKPTFATTNHVAPTFTNGGEDIESTSLCGAVLELAQKIQAEEKTNTANPNRINIQYDTDPGTASISATFSSVKTVTTTGAILHTVTPYLS